MSQIQKRIDFLERRKQFDNFWNISYLQGVFLSELLLLSNKKNILELGTSNGFSTLFLAKNLEKDSKIKTIEVNEERFNLAKENFKIAGVTYLIDSLLGDIFEILDNYQFENKFDFIFLDAAQKDYIKIIDKLIDKNLIEKGALIVADNVNSHNYMIDYVNYMRSNFTIIGEIFLGSGFLVSRY
jgi:predicted O-methyltransferase YrrM